MKNSFSSKMGGGYVYSRGKEKILFRFERV